MEKNLTDYFVTVLFSEDPIDFESDDLSDDSTERGKMDR